MEKFLVNEEDMDEVCRLLDRADVPWEIEEDAILVDERCVEFVSNLLFARKIGFDIM